MSFLSLGLALLLAVHLVASTALSLLVALTLPWVEARTSGPPSRRRASTLLFLGLLPALGGLVGALGLALPAWLVHEPRDTGETAGPALVALAAAGAALVLGRVGGALLGLRRTSRLVRKWEAAGRPLAGLPFPATRLAHEFPVAAVFGLRQGRLFLADRLLRALSPEELDGVVAHEAAHHAAHDNLKRLLLEASPDLLALTGAGARSRRAFEKAAEAAADAQACARVSPLVLARTLLKVAALVPPGQRLDAGVAALHRDGSLSARVQALVAAHDQASASRIPRAESGPGIAHGLGVAFAGAALAAVLCGPGFVSLRTVHGLLEALVHLLS
jgi:Zn-dependent protease with chaperone function